MKLNNKYIREVRMNTLGENGKLMTREELSNKIDVQIKTLQHMETREDFDPRISTMYKFASFFNISIDSLIKTT